jgi:hypothetical protein
MLLSIASDRQDNLPRDETAKQAGSVIREEETQFGER